MEERVYEGSWNNRGINERLKIVLELQKIEKVKEQEKEFTRITGKGRSLFYRYKAFLNRKRDKIGNNKYQKFKGDICYFCQGNKNLIVHHINFNHSDNSTENLLTLCSSCHTKYHLLTKNSRKQSSMEVQKCTSFDMSPTYNQQLKGGRT